MRTKTSRLIVAAIALASLVGMSAPAEAAKPSSQRNVWCC